MSRFKNIDEFREYIKPQQEAYKKLVDERITKRWENLGTFIIPDDVPPIPITKDKATQNYFNNKLIAAGAIQKRDLVDGAYYLGKHRCAKVAQWQRVKNKFKYWKWEFSGLWDYTNHFEDDDGYALFVPILEVTKEEFENTTIDLNQKLEKNCVI